MRGGVGVRGAGGRCVAWGARRPARAATRPRGRPARSTGESALRSTSIDQRTSYRVGLTLVWRSAIRQLFGLPSGKPSRIVVRRADPRLAPPGAGTPPATLSRLVPVPSLGDNGEGPGGSGLGQSDAGASGPEARCGPARRGDRRVPRLDRGARPNRKGRPARGHGPPPRPRAPPARPSSPPSPSASSPPPRSPSSSRRRRARSTCPWPSPGASTRASSSSSTAPSPGALGWAAPAGPPGGGSRWGWCGSRRGAPGPWWR